MPAITPAISRRFIESAALPPVPPRTGLLAEAPKVELKETEAQSLVVGSSLIVAADKVPVEWREDLVNCTLFAQLAATAAVPDRAQVARWYEAYFTTLTALGWAQSDTRLEEYEFSGKNAEVHKAMVKVVAALLGPQAAVVSIVMAALEALQSMSENRPWITLFEQESKSTRSARFQVAAAQVDPEGLLQAALAAFSLHSKSKLTQVLFFKFASSSITFKYAAGKATIYDAALRDQRETIAARLKAYRRAYVGEVKLPAAPLGLLRAPAAAVKRGARLPAAITLSPGPPAHHARSRIP